MNNLLQIIQLHWNFVFWEENVRSVFLDMQRKINTVYSQGCIYKKLIKAIYSGTAVTGGILNQHVKDEATLKCNIMQHFMSKIHSSLLVIETGLFLLQTGQRITLSVCEPEKTAYFKVCTVYQDYTRVAKYMKTCVQLHKCQVPGPNILVIFATFFFLMVLFYTKIHESAMKKGLSSTMTLQHIEL